MRAGFQEGAMSDETWRLTMGHVARQPGSQSGWSAGIRIRIWCVFKRAASRLCDGEALARMELVRTQWAVVLDLAAILRVSGREMRLPRRRVRCPDPHASTAARFPTHLGQ